MTKVLKDLFFLILYYFNAIIRVKPKSAGKPEKILIISWHLLGDTFMSLPVIASIKEHLKTSHITVVCKPFVKEVYENAAEVDEVIAIPDNFFTNPKELKKLRSEYDLTVDFTNDQPSAFFSLISDGKYKIAGSGIYKVLGIKHKGFPLMYDKMLPPPGNDYVKTYLYKIIRQLFPDFSINNSWRFTPPSAQHAGREKAEKDIYIGFGIGSSKNENLWEKDNWILLANRLTEDKDVHVFLMGGNSEINLANEIINDSNERVISLAGKTNLMEAIDKIKGMNFFISNDTGLMHIAVHYNVPVICLYGPSNHLNYLHRDNPRAIALRSKIFCQPCYYFLQLANNTTHHDCRYNIPLCKKLITVNDVLLSFEGIKNTV